MDGDVSQEAVSFAAVVVVAVNSVAAAAAAMIGRNRLRNSLNTLNCH